MPKRRWGIAVLSCAVACGGTSPLDSLGSAEEAADAGPDDSGPDVGGSANPPPGCSRPVGLQQVIPFDRSLYVPENFRVFIEAPGVPLTDVEVRSMESGRWVSFPIEVLAPGIFMAEPPPGACPAACDFEIRAGRERETVNYQLFEGRDTRPPEYAANLRAPSRFEITPGCDRPVGFDLEMGAALSRREENPGATGNILPQTWNALHRVEMATAPGEWTVVGARLGSTERDDRVEVPVFVEAGVGRACFRGSAIDGSGNLTTDTSSICFDVEG